MDSKASERLAISKCQRSRAVLEVWQDTFVAKASAGCESTQWVCPWFPRRTTAFDGGGNRRDSAADSMRKVLRISCWMLPFNSHRWSYRKAVVRGAGKSVLPSSMGRSRMELRSIYCSNLLVRCSDKCDRMFAGDENVLWLRFRTAHVDELTRTGWDLNYDIVLHRLNPAALLCRLVSWKSCR